MIGLFLLLLLFCFVANACSKRSSDTTTWTCITLQETQLAEGAIWRTENCTNGDPLVEPPLLTVNSVHADLTTGKLRAVPGVPTEEFGLQPINQMAKPFPNFIAGINGGYFWRVDVDGVWIDDVCRGKVRKDAMQHVDVNYPNYGVSDGLIKIDGVVKGNNCNCSGYSRPAVLAIDGQSTDIQVLHRGETVADNIKSAIGAGPNLVSQDPTTGESFIDIPADDDNINILEHAANTAVGFKKDATGKTATLIMATTDGSDECGPLDDTCGLMSKALASLMKDKFGCAKAMSMDQGGSTTMWVKGVNPERDCIVSRSHNTRPVEEDGPRNVANGLFIEIVQ